MSDDYETHELEMAFKAGAASRDAEVAKAFEAGRQAEREYRPGYAGATIWIGENLVSSIVTKVKIDHEIEKGQAITNATQWCLDQLAIRARGDAK